MICTNDTEKECLNRNLFGDSEWRYEFLKFVDKGHVGFLLNISKDELLGVFEVMDKARIDVEKDAWGGKFRVQIRVRQVGNLQRIKNASKKLEFVMPLREVTNREKPYKVPMQNTYGPDYTNKILGLFEIQEEHKKCFHTQGNREFSDDLEETLDNVAGLEDVKKFVERRIINPFKCKAAMEQLRLRVGGGILLFGPPGTGKTLIAKAIANSIQAKFIDITPSVISGYPGDAEKRLEKIFSSMENEPRTVLFFDEAEWILQNRDKQNSSIMQRITPLILTQLSQIKKKRKAIIVIAATNKPREIDPAFLRPGRFDKIFFVPLPSKKDREKIIELNLKNRRHDLKYNDISEIAEKLDGFSGADIENIVDETAALVYEENPYGKEYKITKRHILNIVEKTAPSVNKEDYEDYRKWKDEKGIR